MANLKKGINPITKREFLIFKPKGNTYVLSKNTYQTRYGAELEKTQGDIIIARDKLNSYINKAKSFKRKDLEVFINALPS